MLDLPRCVTLGGRALRSFMPELDRNRREDAAPDQISGRLAKDGVAFISHERIYQHVWKDKKDGGTLYLHLRHSALPSAPA